MSPRSPRMVPGAAWAGSVAPISTLPTAIAPSPDHSIATTGPDAGVMRPVRTDELRITSTEAAGHKIRHVPAMLPDILKTEAVLEWEYAAFLDKTPEQASGAMRGDASQAIGCSTSPRQPDSHPGLFRAAPSRETIAALEGRARPR